MKPFNDTANLTSTELNAWICKYMIPGSVTCLSPFNGGRLYAGKQIPGRTLYQIVSRIPNSCKGFHFWMSPLIPGGMNTPTTVSAWEIDISEDTWIPGYDPDQRWGFYDESNTLKYLDETPGYVLCAKEEGWLVMVGDRKYPLHKGKVPGYTQE